jgi:hypothetical protein
MSDLAVNWVKSTYCSDNTCIEVSSAASEVFVRDGKRLDQPFLQLSQADWNDFLDGIIAGDFCFQ